MRSFRVNASAWLDDVVHGGSLLERKLNVNGVLLGTHAHGDIRGRDHGLASGDVGGHGTRDLCLAGNNKLQPVVTVELGADVGPGAKAKVREAVSTGLPNRMRNRAARDRRVVCGYIKCVSRCLIHTRHSSLTVTRQWCSAVAKRKVVVATKNTAWRQFSGEGDTDATGDS